MKKNETGWVYLITDGSAVKVGYSATPDVRQMTLQTGNPRPLRVLCLWPGTRVLERSLQTLLEPTRLKGEWFDVGCIDILYDLAKKEFAGHKR